MITAKEALELSMKNGNCKEDLELQRERINNAIIDAAKNGLRKFDHIIFCDYASIIGAIIEKELSDNDFKVSGRDMNSTAYELIINW